jgi:hypothetical protein
MYYRKEFLHDSPGDCTYYAMHQPICHVIKGDESMHQTSYSTPLQGVGTNPGFGRQQFAQNWNQAPYSQQQNYPGQMAYGGSTLSQFGTNPQVVRQQIAGDQGQGQFNPQQYLNPYAQANAYQPIQNQGYYNPAVFQQVMNSASTNPQYVRSQIEQDIRQGSQPPAYLSNALYSQYGANPQQFGQSAMSSGQSAAMGQAVYGTGTFAQYGTNPQIVQSHIRQDLNQGGYSASAMNQGVPGASTFSEFGTNPQYVRQQISQDLGYQQGFQQGYQQGYQQYQ